LSIFPPIQAVYFVTLSSSLGVTLRESLSSVSLALDAVEGKVLKSGIETSLKD